MKYKVEEDTTLSNFLNPKTNRQKHKKRRGKKGRVHQFLLPLAVTASVALTLTGKCVCVCVCVCLEGGWTQGGLRVSLTY